MSMHRWDNNKVIDPNFKIHLLCFMFTCTGGQNFGRSSTPDSLNILGAASSGSAQAVTYQSSTGQGQGGQGYSHGGQPVAQGGDVYAQQSQGQNYLQQGSASCSSSLLWRFVYHLLESMLWYTPQRIIWPKIYSISYGWGLWRFKLKPRAKSVFIERSRFIRGSLWGVWIWNIPAVLLYM